MLASTLYSPGALHVAWMCVYTCLVLIGFAVTSIVIECELAAILVSAILFMGTMTVYVVAIRRARPQTGRGFRKFAASIAAIFSAATLAATSLVLLLSMYETTGENIAKPGDLDIFSLTIIIAMTVVALATLYCCWARGTASVSQAVLTVAVAITMISVLLTFITSSLSSGALPLDHDPAQTPLPDPELVQKAFQLALLHFAAWVIGVATFSLARPIRILTTPPTMLKMPSGDRYISAAKSMSVLLLTVSTFNCFESGHQTTRFLQLANARRMFAKAYVRSAMAEASESNSASAHESRRILQEYSTRKLREEGRVGIRHIEAYRIVREFIAFAQFPMYDFNLTRDDGSTWSTRVFVDRGSQRDEYSSELSRLAENAGVDVRGIDLFSVFHKLEKELLSKQQMLPGLALPLTAPAAVQLGVLASLALLILFRDNCISAYSSVNCGVGEPWVVCDASTLAARIVAGAWVASIVVAPLISCVCVTRMVIARNLITATGLWWSEMFHVAVALLCCIATAVIVVSSVQALMLCRAKYHSNQAVQCEQGEPA